MAPTSLKRHGGEFLRRAALAACACLWALSGLPAPHALAASRAEGGALVRVALTRERGQNDKLRRLLEERLADVGSPPLELVELPCIEHGPGADLEELEGRLVALAAGDQPFDSVALTSPEAARVFLSAWTAAASDVAKLPVRLACVGEGTAKIVEAAGLRSDFQPSLANAETLAAELPKDFGRVLYPASALAQRTLQQGLAARGFEVERLNTYITQAVREFSEEDQRLMASAAVATFGSPSAVKAWAGHCSGQPVAACIGGTSKKAAEAAGFRHVVAPEKPGLDGWAEVTAAAAREALAEVEPALAS